MSEFRKLKKIGVSLFTIWMVFSGADTTKSQEWKQYLDVDKAGWSSSDLETARKQAAAARSAAVMIVDHGNVVAAWGNIEHPYKAASMRKSIYDATIGAGNYKAPFNINATIEKLEIDDKEALSKEEKQATFEHLMSARSGIYHPAAYETDSNAQRRPERGSAAPGEKWYYNNWDFNVVTEAFEKLSGRDIDSAFVEDLATPVGMEDFESNHIFRWFEPRVSRFPAVTFRISARDLSRVGKLYLQNGKWQDKQIISSEWTKRSTSFLSTFEEGHYGGEGNGYGRMWWIYPARPDSDSLSEKYFHVEARGTGGQTMVLYPELDLLIVHLADTDRGSGVSGNDLRKLMDLILVARKKAPQKDAILGPVVTNPLSGEKPAPLRKDYSEVPKEKLGLLEGSFMFSEKQGIRLYRYEDRLFAEPLGMPLADAEMFMVSDNTLRSPLVDLVIEPQFEEGKKVENLMVTFRGQKLKAIRTDR